MSGRRARAIWWNLGSPLAERMRSIVVVGLVLFFAGLGCQGHRAPSISPSVTFAELRTIKGAPLVRAPGEATRAPYPRERLLDGSRVTLDSGALTWMRRDAGAIWLIAGPADFTLHADNLDVAFGRLFVDSELGGPVELSTPRGKIELSEARVSIDVGRDGSVSAYVLRGSVRAGNRERVGAGELLTWETSGALRREASRVWDDWTGGLATADPAAEPAPFGVGTVGARKPGDRGQPRSSLVIQRLDVRVTIDRDFALTEVDETFVNPTSDDVEGLFSFRTPPSAVLSRFGVDRNGGIVWGRIQEARAAVKQYESNVYAGSQEEPALLQWVGSGVYSARLFPIHPGETRRVVTRYGEWLSRQGALGERRLYVYPMAAEGARASLPRIEELRFTLDLTRSGALRVRSGMGGKRQGNQIVVKAFDFVPRADLSVELFDNGQSAPVAYRAPHRLAAEDVVDGASSDFASVVAREEADYVALPLRAFGNAAPSPPGIDVGIVIDTSAATEPAALALARSMASSLLAELGPEDRVALWAGDATLRGVAAGSDTLGPIDEAKRRAYLAGLAAVERGGATDLGALLTEAASKLDPKRRGAVIYVGDGLPSVGELAPKSLRERLARLGPEVRILAAGIGSQPNLALLDRLVRGAPVERVADAYGAAEAALRLLEAASRPLWIGAQVDFGSGVERVLPRELPAISADDSVLVVGRLSGKAPTTITLRGAAGSVTRPLRVEQLTDFGDLRRRWGEGRLSELLAEGAGRASLVEVARRFALVSPFTALYVPTEREQASPELASVGPVTPAVAKRRRWKPWSQGGEDSMAPGLASFALRAASAPASKEGGTGTRAKGEAAPEPALQKAAAATNWDGKADKDAQRPVAEEQAFGMAGIQPRFGGATAAEAPAPAAPAPAASAAAQQPRGLSATGNMFDAEPSAASKPVAPARAGMGLEVTAKRASGGGLAGLSALSRREPVATGSIGASHLGAGARGNATIGAPIHVGGIIPNAARVVAGFRAGFRACYLRALNEDSSAEGSVRITVSVGPTGAVTNASLLPSGSLPESLTDCMRARARAAQFDPPGDVPAAVVFSVTLTPPESSEESPAAPPSVAQARTPAPPVKAVPSPEKPPVEPTLGRVHHEARPCSLAADLPLAERRVLWRERLTMAHSATLALAVYRGALDSCEATRWDERALLLVSLVDRLPSIRDRVELWRALLQLSPAAADAVYRFLTLRVQTAEDLKALHDALGLERIDPTILAALLKKARSATERLSLLRAAAERFKDDTELALLVLAAYEDAHDDAGGRAFARGLRRRVDATAHVRTQVGEYYLRLAAASSGALAERDRQEARRTFGELVEFAPEDPLARRRLGDLLRAHGWYEEASRQYETLSELTPDDASVQLLRALAANGLGRVEEAVRWAEKVAGAGAEDGSSPVAVAARAEASVFLAWARKDALSAGRKDEAARLLARALRLAARDGAKVRFILTWAHPELRPALWTMVGANSMPAADNLPLYGVAQAFLPVEPAPAVELRLDPEDAASAARLDARAMLTAIVAEGSAEERIARLELAFRDAQGRPLERVQARFENGELVLATPVAVKVLP